MAQTTINDTQGVVTREAGTGTRFENNVTMTGNSGVGVDPGPGKVIGSLTLTSGGSGYTNGTYSQVALTGGSGTGATADIVVAANAVTVVTLRNPGQGYVVGDTLSCASIGAGSNFSVTVATTASIMRSDGTIVGSRIGAGTTTPIAGVESTTGIVSTQLSQLVAGVRFPGNTARGMSVIGTSVLPQGISSQSVTSRALLDLSLQTGSTGHYGIFSAPEFRGVSSSGTTSVWGSLGSAFFYDAGTTNGTFNVFGVSGQTSVGAPIGANNTFTLVGVQSANVFTATNAQIVTTYTAFQANSSFSGAAHAIGTYYGIQLSKPTLSGGTTITNRWSISQEDDTAKNVLAGMTALGQAAGTVATAFGDFAASTTAAASIRLRSGTAPTSPNDGDVWFDGSALKIRIGGVTKTVTVS